MIKIYNDRLHNNRTHRVLPPPPLVSRNFLNLSLTSKDSTTMTLLGILKGASLSLQKVLMY
ncbi:hypothetical protein, partial [Helicobacter cinaedi]|uniref:hypothetical protein n=1 Tax=Helicobacter cinaedi TaxID=213 RepID=UPI001403D846